MTQTTSPHVADALDEIRSSGLLQDRAHDRSPQRTHILVGAGEVLNLCANNYLGLADHPEVIQAAHAALDRWGYGLASVRFICGTQTCHKQLEDALTAFLGTEDTILYSSCFDANGGLFETLLGERGRGDQRRAQSRFDHRRHPALEGEAIPLPARRHERPGGESCAKRTPPGADQADHYRRRVLDGWPRGAAGRDLRTGRPLQRAGALRRLPRHGLLGPNRPRHARALRRDGPRGSHHGHAGQGAGRRQRRLHERPPRDSSNCCGSARGRTCFRTPLRRRSSAVR